VGNRDTEAPAPISPTSRRLVVSLVLLNNPELLGRCLNHGMHGGGNNFSCSEGLYDEGTFDRGRALGSEGIATGSGQLAPLQRETVGSVGKMFRGSFKF
jgi:hypothetical protein